VRTSKAAVGAVALVLGAVLFIRPNSIQQSPQASVWMIRYRSCWEQALAPENPIT
jgi:hypothetical protein